jgi:hypothetical protein
MHVYHIIAYFISLAFRPPQTSCWRVSAVAPAFFLYFRMGPPATPDGALNTQPFIILPPFPPLLLLVVLSTCILSRRSSLVLSLSILVTPWRLLTVPLPHPSILPVHKPPWRSPSSALSRRTAQFEVVSTFSMKTGRKLADTTRLHTEVARPLETGKESNRQPRS